MNGQKDTQRTDMSIYRQGNVSYNKPLSNMPIDDFANKKTEKLVTALYMVTDCMDTDDALKGKLRLLGVELLSDMYKLATLSPMDKYNRTPVCLARIYELLSFIEIAYTIGFISEMNTVILKKEFEGLASNLKSRQSKDKHFTFSLNSKMFEVPAIGNNFNNKKVYSHNNIKDMSAHIGNSIKRTSYNNISGRPIGVSFINNGSPLENNNGNYQNKQASNLSDREDRIKKIISIIKDKSVLPENKDGVSIKDISLAFTDCSEKTIQRDLNSLVQKGQISKTGSKRWSRYAYIITNY